MGKSGRLAHIVAEAHPFTSAMWTVCQEVWVADTKGIREAPPREAVRSRFVWAAKWFIQLIAAYTDLSPLKYMVSHLPATVATTVDVVMQFGTSPWGELP